MSQDNNGAWHQNKRGYIVDSAGRRIVVGGFTFCVCSTEETRANDRRILASVNACEGFSTGSLELIASAGGMRKKMVVTAVVLEQRDALLEVVREFVQTMDTLPDSDETSLRVWDVYDTARKLIERMQRGAGDDSPVRQ